MHIVSHKQIKSAHKQIEISKALLVSQKGICTQQTIALTPKGVSKTGEKESDWLAGRRNHKAARKVHSTRLVLAM
jgi:hypothetical protein